MWWRRRFSAWSLKRRARIRESQLASIRSSVGVRSAQSAPMTSNRGSSIRSTFCGPKFSVLDCLVQRSTNRPRNEPGQQLHPTSTKRQSCCQDVCTGRRRASLLISLVWGNPDNPFESPAEILARVTLADPVCRSPSPHTPYPPPTSFATMYELALVQYHDPLSVGGNTEQSLSQLEWLGSLQIPPKSEEGLNQQYLRKVSSVSLGSSCALAKEKECGESGKRRRSTWGARQESRNAGHGRFRVGH